MKEVTVNDKVKKGGRGYEQDMSYGSEIICERKQVKLQSIIEYSI